MPHQRLELGARDAVVIASLDLVHLRLGEIRLGSKEVEEGSGAQAVAFLLHAHRLLGGRHVGGGDATSRATVAATSCSLRLNPLMRVQLSEKRSVQLLT